MESPAVAAVIEAPDTAPEEFAASTFMNVPEKRADLVQAAQARKRHRLTIACAGLLVVALAAGMAAYASHVAAERDRTEQPGISTPTGQADAAEPSQAVYRYKTAAPDGAVCDAEETAEYDEAGKLAKSTVAVTLPSEEVAKKYVDQARTDFGDDFVDGSAEGKVATVVIDMAGSDVSRDAYEAMLSANVEGFELVS